MEDIKQVYAAPDGTQFATKAEAVDYMRRPKIKEALSKVIEGNDDLVDWLIENQADVTDAFSTGQIRRVSKSDKAKLTKALEAVVENGDAKFKFLIENKDDMIAGFRWPSVTRMSDEEKASATKQELTVLADGNEELADFVIANKTPIFEAYEAGKVKRVINPKAQEGLAKWREEQAAQKAAAEAGEKTPAPKAAKPKTEEPAAE